MPRVVKNALTEADLKWFELPGRWNNENDSHAHPFYLLLVLNDRAGQLTDVSKSIGPLLDRMIVGLWVIPRRLLATSYGSSYKLLIIAGVHCRQCIA